jgi:anaerobic magnesium-protoporphyrin IX monomethyl ester cyclase
MEPRIFKRIKQMPKDMRNITLIEANAGLWKPGVFTRHSSFEPLGLEYVGAVLEQEGYNVNILQQKNKSADKFLREILETEPDLVGFSTMTYNFPLSKSLANVIKETNSNIYTVFGGVHISSHPQSIDDKVIDYGIVGEGEYVFRDLVKALDNGQDPKKVKGITYWDNGVKFTGSKERIENLDELPFPLRTRENLENTTINSIMYPSRSEQKAVASIAYSRGCPYGCSYCASKNIWGKNVKWRSAKNVIEEIKELQKRFGTNTIFFTDLTFNVNPEKVYELCNELKKQKVDINWYAMLRIADPNGRPLADKKFLKAMKDAGCSKVSYGIETVIPEIQKDYNKPLNLEGIRKILEAGDSIGLINKGYFIIGDPRIESKETLERTKKIISELPFDDIRISFLTPFPGTDLYEQYKSENRITTDDFARYSSDELILRLNKINKNDLEEAQRDIFTSFVLNENYGNRRKFKIKKFPFLKKSYEEYFGFLKSKEAIKNG